MKASFSAQSIAAIVDGEIIGDAQVVVHDLAPIDLAGPEHLSFITHDKYMQAIQNPGPGVLLVSDGIDHDRHTGTKIIVPDARRALYKILSALEKMNLVWTVAKMIEVHDTCSLPKRWSCGSFTVLSEHVALGENVRLGAHCFVGPRAKIGANTIIEQGVHIAADTVIGENCYIGPQCVIGAVGFGYYPDENKHYHRIPHVGNVQLSKGVELGAHCMIDRAVIGSTLIGEGVIMDNAVHVAHNVRIGAHTAIAAQVAIAGSAEIGAHCQIGGQAGVVGHIKVADGSLIQAQTGVASTIEQANQKWAGTPAMPFTRFYRSSILFKALPELRKKLEGIEKQLNNSTQ